MPGSRLSLDEREEIRVGLEAGKSMAVIAVTLRRATSTVSREIARNGGPGAYRAGAAERRAQHQAQRPKPFKLVADPELAERVEDELKAGYSPQGAAKRLAAVGLRISHETIYQACYHPGRGLDDHLWKHLPRRRQKRRHGGRQWGASGVNPLGEPVSVHRRHPIASDRTQYGHLEGDLIIGAHNRSAAITLCGRHSRYTWLGALPHGYHAEQVAETLCELLDDIAPHLRRTLTWDQGREMKYWADIQAATGTLIYFCDPHSPWQRPTNENNNGLLRRWLPKGTPLNTYTQTDLNEIAQRLNHMPRRIFGWDTAQDRYDHHVAMTT